MEFSKELCKIVSGELTEESPIICKKHTADDQCPPITKHTVCYIVACVLINEDDEVLLIQEAKRSCYGLWYLPAGRVEPRETLLEGARRELMEEAGFDFDPQTLVLVEIQCGYWYRFTFTGPIVSGSLKTMEDKESIQAKWWPIKDLAKNPQLKLRCRDMLPQIEAVRQYLLREDKLITGINVTLKPHKQSIIRLLICTKPTSATDFVSIVAAGKETKYLPSAVLIMKNSFMDSVYKLLSSIFQDYDPIKLKFLGIISMEHDGTKTEPENQSYRDGFCMTLMISVDTSDEFKLKKKFSWQQISKGSELYKNLEPKLQDKSSAICQLQIL